MGGKDHAGRELESLTTSCGWALGFSRKRILLSLPLRGRRQRPKRWCWSIFTLGYPQTITLTRPLSWVCSGELLPHMLAGINYKCPKDADMSPEGNQFLVVFFLKKTFASTLMSGWSNDHSVVSEVALRGCPPGLQLAEIAGLVLFWSSARRGWVFIFTPPRNCQEVLRYYIFEIWIQI